jgi:beta-glucosidase
MVKRLGDRVKYWTTFNEPSVVALDGNLMGEHAPGLQDPRIAFQVAHHLMVAHGLAVQAIRAADPSLEVGIVLNLWGADAASEDPADVAAANVAWERSETHFLDPLFKGHYASSTYELLGDNLPKIRDGDMALIAQKLDTLGINFYSRNLITADGNIDPVPGSEYTEMGWEVCAPALRRLLNRINTDYHLPPIYITENGAAFKDEVSADGKIISFKRASPCKMVWMCAATSSGRCLITLNGDTALPNASVSSAWITKRSNAPLKIQASGMRM